jgi:hypothetical protein
MPSVPDAAAVGRPVGALRWLLAVTVGFAALLCGDAARSSGTVTFIVRGSHSVRLRVATDGERKIVAPCDSLPNRVLFDGELGVDQAMALPWNRCICFEHTMGSSRIDWEPARVSCQVPASIVIQN